MQNEILSKTKIKINQEQKEFCERNLELSELEQGKDHLPLGKSAGLDGLPVEFYRKLWPIIKLDFFKMVQEVQNLGVVSNSQRKDAIRLVFKKEDRSDMKFYRPISLLNVDVNIITETPGLRLGKILPSVINKDQTGIPGRNIVTNLYTLNYIVKYANQKNVEAAILFLDREKAFDRVDHQFLLKTLKHLHFWDNFISLIEFYSERHFKSN